MSNRCSQELRFFFARPKCRPRISGTKKARIKGRAFINPATKYIVFSRVVRVHGKASKRRCSTPTASFDNADRGRAQLGLPFIN